MKKIQPLDLRMVSRHANRDYLKVFVFTEGHRNPVLWISAGQATLRPPSSPDRGNWRLSVRAKSGVTDAEHDSSYVLALDLYGVYYMGTENGESTFHAMIAPGMVDDFCVPLADYDPEKLPGACTCTECATPHTITEYLPPTNPELFRHLAGSYVELHIGSTAGVR